MKFVDEISILVSSGKGGPGAISFLRASMTPRGGPDGGDGGRGGHLVFRVNPQLNTLLNYRFKKRFAADNGTPGGGRNMTGPDGQDLVLQVPPGTLVRAEDGTVLLDLKEPGDAVFLKGGRGGKGNWFFRTSTNQAPEKAQPGEQGEERSIHLELKLIADVGVIGYPNAGKSTFISRISAARPKIADYPFTTLTPNLGVVRFDQDRSMVVADIPGLVPGASEGVGLGTQFLRHIERTSCFIHLVDASEASGRDALQDFRDIQNELRAYDRTKDPDPDYVPLTNRRQIVAFNKIDAVARDRVEELQARIKQEDGVDARAISAVTGQGVSELIYEAGRIVFEQRSED